MGKVLKSDAASGEAVARFALPSDAPSVWATFQMRFDAATRALWVANGGPVLMVLEKDTVAVCDRFTAFLPGAGYGSEDFAGSPANIVADVWAFVEYHYVNGTLVEVYVDGNLEATGVTSGTEDVDLFSLGQSSIFAGAEGAVVYYDDVTLGTTRGGTEIFSDDFQDGTLDAWTSTDGDVSVVSFSTPVLGLCIAPDDPWNEPNPTWTRLDDPDQDWRLRVNSVQIDRGVDAATDTVKTGTCVAVLKDPFGTMDPTNTTSPFWDTGNSVTKLNPNIQAAYARWNPVTEEWSTRFRGFVKSIRHTMDTSGFSEVTLELVDGWELLADLRLTPGDQGDTPPDESVGDIYYEGGSVIPAQDVFKHVDERIAQALDDAGWPGTGETRDIPNLRDIFSGNVSVQEEVYARDGQIVEVIADAADAEFPDVSRAYFSRTGVFSFRGRFARFFPENPGYGIGNWELGGSAEAAADSDVVLLSDFTFRRSKEDIINVATSLPKGLEDGDVPGQMVTDATSIAKYGRRPWMADNLLTWHGHNEDLSETTAAEETHKYAEFKVDNFKEPHTRIERVTVTWRHSESFSGPAAWAFLNGVELGDLAHVETTHRGGGGFDEDYFVEAIRELDEPADGDTHKVTMQLDVSPRSFYAENPFGAVDVGVS